MRNYKFDKPLVETELLPKDTNVYYVDVDEPTGKFANLMEFVGGEWRVKAFADDIALWNRSSSRLSIPTKVKLNPDGIIAAWLSGNEYESNVKEAASDLSYIIGELTDFCTVVTNAITSLNGTVDAITAAGATDAATTVSNVASNLSTQLDRIVEGHAVEHLGALNIAINGVQEEPVI